MRMRQVLGGSATTRRGRAREFPRARRRDCMSLRWAATRSSATFSAICARAMNVSRETIARRLATQRLDHRGPRGRRRRGPAALARRRAASCAATASCCGSTPSRMLWRIQRPAAGAGEPCAAADAGPARTGARRCRRRPNGLPAACAQRAHEDRAAESRAPPARRMRALFALSARRSSLLARLCLCRRMRRLQPVYPAIAHAARPARGSRARRSWSTSVLLTAPRRDGLRWIEVSDPQVRKADKLPTEHALATRVSAGVPSRHGACMRLTIRVCFRHGHAHERHPAEKLDKVAAALGDSCSTS